MSFIVREVEVEGHLGGADERADDAAAAGERLQRPRIFGCIFD